MASLYLNDWAVVKGTDISRQFSCVRRFVTLLDLLGRHGFSNVVVPDNYADMIWCGYLFKSCFYKDEILTDDQRFQMSQLVNHFQKAGRLPIDNYIYLTRKQEKSPSVLLGNASFQKGWTVSVTFDHAYETNTIDGVLHLLSESDPEKDVRLGNFYDAAVAEAILAEKELLEGIKGKNPMSEPLWNTEVTANYMAQYPNLSKELSEHPDQKEASLTKHATRVAELNGWEYDDVVTRKNKSPKHLRHIFRSSRFSRGNCYLSIDFEKFDVYFELCNHRGKHCGQVRWDGEMKDPEERHDIIV